MSRAIWSFHYDEDDFLIAENPEMESSVVLAVSDYLDDALGTGGIEVLISEWRSVGQADGPEGLGFNATLATLDKGQVTIKSFYEQFETVSLKEEDFLAAVTDLREYLRGEEGR
ncbi:hypothetical protein HUT18_07100 [Streptomyces sp. NA04227]|uniref:hypothetical protein n=1 Tax=Streptomyces sp. NA04227 TaxID=2742136 RepID=UPI00158FC1D9|nr:hypothetical protein [Streptomyces sp. NA04227]QKW06205.1 hypothetical protein HUT18_07100 [Streptomyces sp. NA04227]